MAIENGKRRLAGIYLRGMAMGAADVVPGVSGGTVAFITGIYQELLDSIKSFRPGLLPLLVKQGPLACWREVNGSFLVTLLLGIVTSILTLARLISHLLETQPLLIWSFFFGLIAASAWHMARQISVWRPTIWGALLLGAVIAFVIAELKPSQLTPTLPLVFMAGSIAICAMILPGISGSFILLLMGMYSHILGAIKDFNLLLLVCFAAGCGTGLLAFSHLLSWLFKRFYDTTLALLTGFLIGSLNLVWPWKQTLSYYQNSQGEQLALQQQNVMPSSFYQLTGENPLAGFCLILMIFGFLVVICLEKLGGNSAE